MWFSPSITSNDCWSTNQVALAIALVAISTIACTIMLMVYSAAYFKKRQHSLNKPIPVENDSTEAARNSAAVLIGGGVRPLTIAGPRDNMKL